VSHSKRPAAAAGEKAIERPALPRGALVMMRKSGGIHFSTREIVVYRNGKASYTPGGAAGGPEDARRWKLSLAEIAELHSLLDRSGLGQTTPGGSHGPDSFAYELVGRVGRTVRSAEVFEGNIPAALAPLIRHLRALMPDDDEESPADGAP
jgi:hypothetical protein